MFHSPQRQALQAVPLSEGMLKADTVDAMEDLARLERILHFGGARRFYDAIYTISKSDPCPDPG